MKSITHAIRLQDRDELRLLGLSRIPRCVTCPRLAALEEALRTRTPLASPWPPAAKGCRHRHCTPMLRRFTASMPADGVRKLLAADHP